METIISKNNQAVKAAKKLLQKKYRRIENRFLAEGDTLVGDLNDEDVVRYFVSSEYQKPINERKTLRLSPEVFQTLCETKNPSGIVAELNIPPQNYIKGKDTLILDGVSDPGNLGTLLRTAACCAFANAILINCADPFEGKAVRASMGGVLKINLTMFENSQDALNLIEGAAVYAMDMGGENLTQAAKIEPIVLAVGSEAKGLSETLRKRARLVALPMSGNVESLNAAVAGSVGMYVLKYFIK